MNGKNSFYLNEDGTLKDDRVIEDLHTAIDMYENGEIIEAHDILLYIAHPHGHVSSSIKIYNEDGKVRVVKVASNGIEQAMFSNVADGEVAIIDVEVANLSVQGNLDSISR